MTPGPRDIEENRGEAILLQDRSAEGLDLIYKFLIRREQEYIPDGAPQNLDAFWKHEYHNKDGHDLVKIRGDKSQGRFFQITGQEKGQGHAQTVYNIQFPSQKLCGEGGKMMMLAAPRQNWKRETWALFMGLPPDKAESRTSADTPMVTDSIITPLIMTNMDSSWKYP